MNPSSDAVWSIFMAPASSMVTLATRPRLNSERIAAYAGLDAGTNTTHLLPLSPNLHSSVAVDEDLDPGPCDAGLACADDDSVGPRPLVESEYCVRSCRLSGAQHDCFGRERYSTGRGGESDDKGGEDEAPEDAHGSFSDGFPGIGMRESGEAPDSLAATPAHRKR